MTSPFEQARAHYQPRYPACLSKPASIKGSYLAGTTPAEGSLTGSFPRTCEQAGRGLLRFAAAGALALTTRPLHVAVVLSGGPAPGGHNVIWGLLEALLALSPDSKLTGFRGGPGGILTDQALSLDLAALEPHRNTGGFNLLGTGRGKIDTPQKLAKCKDVLLHRGVDVLVIIGGDDSNTNAAVLAEYLLSSGTAVRVLGVPKTIDGDLQNAFVETTFGFDSAVRVYAELIANIDRDACSGRKLYHFIRLMGRAASHITLEAALQTQPTLALIAEEVAEHKQTLHNLVEQLAAMVKSRAAAGLHYGVVLIPEGLIEFIPEMKTLMQELNQLLAEHKDYVSSLSDFAEQSDYLQRKLSRDAAYTYTCLPPEIQQQLLLDRDPHGNVALSRIETEKLLLQLVRAHLAEETAAGRFSATFDSQNHFIGYEGRCVGPTNFDADYAYSLGRTAAVLAASGVSGYMAVIRGLARGLEHWEPCGVPLLAMMTEEKRGAHTVPVIKKGLVDLRSAGFQYFKERREAWLSAERGRFSGPIQYFGPAELVDRVPLSLALAQGTAAQLCW